MGEHFGILGMIFKSDPDGHKAKRATRPCPRYRGPGKRLCLAPGVRVQWPRRAQRLAGSAPAPPHLADRPEWRLP